MPTTRTRTPGRHRGPRRRRHRPATLRVLSLNTHVGASIRNGTLTALVERTRPHIIVVQEVRRPMRALLARVLGPGWRVCGVAGALVCVHVGQPRFQVAWVASPDNAHGERDKAGGRRIRHRTAVGVDDRRTGRRVVVQSVHVQPLGKGLERAHPGARRRQTRQLRAYAGASAGRGPELVVIDGGDFNQDMDTNPGSLSPRVRGASALQLWQRARMVPAHTLVKRPGRVHLDEFMVRPDDHVSVKGRRVIETHRRGDDHPGVLLTLRVARAR